MPGIVAQRVARVLLEVCPVLLLVRRTLLEERGDLARGLDAFFQALVHQGQGTLGQHATYIHLRERTHRRVVHGTRLDHVRHGGAGRGRRSTEAHGGRCGRALVARRRAEHGHRRGRTQRRAARFGGGLHQQGHARCQNSDRPSRSGKTGLAPSVTQTHVVEVRTRSVLSAERRPRGSGSARRPRIVAKTASAAGRGGRRWWWAPQGSYGRRARRARRARPNGSQRVRATERGGRAARGMCMGRRSIACRGSRPGPGKRACVQIRTVERRAPTWTAGASRTRCGGCRGRRSS